MDTVVGGIRQALDGVTFRLVQEGHADREVLMGRFGMPLMIRHAATGEMVIEYLLNSTTQMWTVAARESGARDIAITRPLEMLRTPAFLRSGETRRVSNCSARSIVSPLPFADGPSFTGDPAPNPSEFVPLQSLWIDTSSLLPLRWELSQRQAVVGALDFVYEFSSFGAQPVEAPTCI